MNTAKQAVQMSLTTILKFLVVVMGLMVIVACFRYAIDYRETTHKSNYVVSDAREMEKQLQCLSRNIYWEAANEPFEGKVAVAQVTLNRVESGKFPDSVCGVVYQKTKFVDRVVCQFSWFCETNHVTRPIHNALFKESEEVAKMVLLEGFRLPAIKEAMYYHADYVNPKWNLPKIKQIGRHIFYKERTGA
jgi:spore germination cell wall hydrolase CwlJ-like protein